MVKSIKKHLLLAVLFIMLATLCVQGVTGMVGSAFAFNNTNNINYNSSASSRISNKNANYSNGGTSTLENYFSNVADWAIANDNKTAVAVENSIDDIITWKKESLQLDDSGVILSDPYLSYAGSTAGDWLPIGLGRYGYSDDYDAYLAVIADYVNAKYATKDKLDKHKATEWHRIALAITASGGNPLSIGNYQGNPINLIADGTYNRAVSVSPGRQGINGWIWALIALDSQRYDVPTDAFHTRQDFIVEILKCQLADGGFALSGSKSDADVTAMALQALAPYYNSEIEYSYISSKIKDTSGDFISVKKTVKQIVDEALQYLSIVQSAAGDYYSWGMANLESTCQVMVALTALNINPLTDSRFIKSGNTLLDGIMKYQLENGGFLHSFTFDPDNPSAKPGVANDMASDQALYALVSLWRNANGMRTLYDMRNEFTSEQREQISTTILAIDELTELSLKGEVEGVLCMYNGITELDRCYVTNYWKLSQLLKTADIELPEENPDYDGGGSGNEDIITYFTSSDAKIVRGLPSIARLTTDNYTEVVRLKFKLDKAENASEFADYKIILDKAYNQIIIIQREIDSINAEILDKLHPFDKIGLADKKVVYSIMDRYNALSEHDRGKVMHYDDLLKCKTQVDNMTTGVIISVVCGVVVVALVGIILASVLHYKKKKRALMMTESEE